MYMIDARHRTCAILYFLSLVDVAINKALHFLDSGYKIGMYQNHNHHSCQSELSHYM